MHILCCDGHAVMQNDIAFAYVYNFQTEIKKKHKKKQIRTAPRALVHCLII